MTGPANSLSALPCLAAALLLGAPSAAGAGPPQAADDWLADAGQFPASLAIRQPPAGKFSNFSAEPLVGKLRITWRPETPAAAQKAILHTSIDHPGHWPSRHWKRHEMSLRGQQWQTSLPIEDVSIPVVYFIQTADGDVSPMRICHPRKAGMDSPSRPFWPYLEGFEEGAEGWTLLSGTGESRSSTPVTRSNEGRLGRHSLKVSIPEGKFGTSVGTSVIRGWQIRNQGARGIRLWLRTRSGKAAVRFALYSNAFSDRQAISYWPHAFTASAQWQPVDMFFHEFPKLTPGEVDFFALEFAGTGPVDILVDDVQLKGSWRLPLE